jgi:hypothetical protein
MLAWLAGLRLRCKSADVGQPDNTHTHTHITEAKDKTTYRGEHTAMKLNSCIYCHYLSASL